MAEPSRKRVLLVDHDPAARRLAASALEGLAIELDLAEDGLAALTRIEAARPDLIVLDLGAPRLDGMTFVRALRTQPDARAIPLIVATERDDPAAMIEATSLGVRYYLTKPFSAEELAVRVRRILGV